ncbi:MAG: SIS domain-containing protein [Patescibacteria group bacterium]
MKNFLDDIDELKKYNQLKETESVAFLPEQLLDSWQSAKVTALKITPQKFNNLAVCGMGGSNLASEIIRGVYSEQLEQPLILIRNYGLPKCIKIGSLVIISSYSGNTEETISCFLEAKKRKAKIVCISSGGRLEALAKKTKTPFFKLNSRYNPSKQPRYGLGLQLMAVLVIFCKLKLIKIGDREVIGLARHLKGLDRSLGWAAKTDINPAKQAAIFLKGSVPLVVGSGFLAANAHILANQLNESAKVLAYPYLLPELNHHLLDGLMLPPASARQIKFLFFNSNQLHPRIQKRYKITQKILKKQKIEFMEYLLASDEKLASSLEILFFGSYLSFYLAVLNQQEPAAVPWVDYLKAELKK